MKKMLSLALALIMALALCIPAFADTDPAPTPTYPGSLTIKDAELGKTYELYRIFDMTKGSGNAVAYTINNDWKDFFISSGTETAPGEGYIVGTNTNNDLTPITVNGASKYINITNASVEEFAQLALGYVGTKNLTAVATRTIVAADITAEGATKADVKISNLPYGYYLMYPQGATEIKDSYGSICSLDSTNPDAEVVIKATYPTIVKTGDKTNLNIGETVNYTIKGTVPDTTGYTSYTYKITDTMSEGLDLDYVVEDNTVVKGITVTVDGTSAETLATNMRLSAQDFSITPTKRADGTYSGFIVQFDMAKWQTYVGKEIVVTYSATTNSNAIVKIDTNKAKLEYTNGNTTTTTPEQEHKVYNSEIVINKYDGSNTSTKLAGAEFVLYKNVKTNVGGQESTKAVYYKLDATTKDVTWVDSIDSATRVTTNTNGAAEFEGLADGEYYLKETKAPDGYNLLTSDTKVTVQGSDTDTTQLTQTVSIANNSGFELPSTGGMGTTIFYTLGGLLMAGAVVLLITKKKMAGEE